MEVLRAGHPLLTWSARCQPPESFRRRKEHKRAVSAYTWPPFLGRTPIKEPWPHLKALSGSKRGQLCQSAVDSPSLAVRDDDGPAIEDRTESLRSSESDYGFSNDWDKETEPSGMYAANWRLMEELRAIVEAEFGALLHPSATPADIRSFEAPGGAAEGGLLFRAGDREALWMFMQGRMRASPPGFCLFTSSVWLGPSTDTPHIIFEINTSPHRVFFSIDLFPRRDLVLDLEYLDAVYTYSGMKDLAARLDKDPRFTKYTSPDLFVRAVVSPTHLCYTYAVPGHRENGVEAVADSAASTVSEVADTRPVAVAVRDLVAPITREVMDIWLRLLRSRKGNVPPGPPRAAISWRDAWSRTTGTRRDPGTVMAAKVLGDVADRVVSAMSGGAHVQLTSQEHWLLGEPQWRHWHGLYTRYAADGALVETYPFLRDFKPDEGQTKIIQHNTRFKPKGYEYQGPWEFGIQTSKPDGIYYSQEDMRTYYLPGGNSCCVQPTIGAEGFFRIEAFLMSSDKSARVSVIPLYGDDGELMVVLLDREVKDDIAWTARGGLTAEGTRGVWSPTALHVASAREEPQRTLCGPVISLSKSLVLYEMWQEWGGYTWHGQTWDPTSEMVPPDDYVLLHLPDKLSLYVPKRVRQGKGFVLGVHWREGENTMHSLAANYDAGGHFRGVTNGWYSDGRF